MFGFAFALLLAKHRLFWKRHPFLRVSLQAVVALAIVGLFSAFFIGRGYYLKAAEHDPAAVAEFQRGGMVLDAEGEMIGSLADDGRILVQREEIPNHLVAALMAAEDSRFYDHPGFDAIGIVRAAIANFRKNEIDQGGSTITQQLARNSCDLGGRTIHRKLVEVFFAAQIEKEFSKDEIVTHYLNRIYFGSGFHGVGAAANGYFGKDVSELTVAESAMLCGLIRRPNALSPFNNLELAELNKERVLDRMVLEGFLDSEVASEPAFRVAKVVENKGRNNRPRFLLSQIRKEARSLMGERPASGIVVETSLNSGLQKFGESILAERITEIESKEGRDFPHPTRADYKSGRITSPSYLQGSAVVIENTTGRIVSAICSRDPFESDYDRVTLSRRSAGTAFLPFVYAAAYESGVANPVSTVYDVPMDNREVMLGGQSGILGEWGAETSGRQYLGTVPSGYALIAGKNAATVRLGFETGLDNVKAIAHQAGINSTLPDYPSTFLGAGGVNLLELTHAYTTFPNKGWRTGRVGLIDRITTRDGELIYQRSVEEEKPRRAFSERTADQIRTLLSQAIHERASAETSAKLASLGSKVAGMTGTSCNSEDNWFVGFNDRYTWGVWVGMDLPQPIYKNAFAKDTALPIWSDFALSLDPQEKVLAMRGEKELTPLCVDSGCLAHVGCRERGHRLIGIPRTSDVAHLAYCRSNDSRKELSETAKLANFRAEPMVRAVPISLKDGPTRPSNTFAPVKTETPPLVGENVFGILDELAVR